MASNQPQLSFLEKADLLPGMLQVFGAVLYAAATGPFRGDWGAKTYRHHIGNAAFRKLETRLSLAQAQYAFPSTAQVYAAYCKSKKIEPVTVNLSNGAQGHWIGNKDARHVFVYYHGGGFCLAMNEAYMVYLGGTVDEMKAAGKDFAILALSYTLAPNAVYPSQIEQAVDLLRYVLEETNRKPSDVIIGGDSAGGSLALAVLSHLSHPHSKIKPLEVTEPLMGAVLISPWVSFDTNKPSVAANQYKDLVAPKAASIWSGAMLGDAPRDNYNEAGNAPIDWWKGVKAKDIIIVGGTDEILLDSIVEIAKKIETAHPSTETFIAKGEYHDMPLLAPAVGDHEPTQQGEAIRAWFSSRL